MSRSRILSSIAAAAIGIVMLGACSTEALTERAVGFGLEQALEGDQDIDLDFGQDGGGFNISTEEGDFSLSFDEDSAGIVFDTDEGDGVISFDENGIVFDTDEGDGVITFDEENGTINFDTDQGDGSINFGDNGDVTLETEEGQFGIFNSAEAPPSWPQELSVPVSLVPGSEPFSVIDFGQGEIITGAFTHAPEEPYAASLISTLLSNGWAENISSSQDGTTFAQFSKDGMTIQIVGDGNGSTTVNITDSN